MFCVSCDKTFPRRDVMLRHFRNKHGTRQPYPQIHHAYPPPPPSSPIQAYQQSRSHNVYPLASPPPPPPSRIQTYKQSWTSITAATTTAAATTADTAATTTTTDIRSRQTFRDRPAAERRISLKRCCKTVGPRWHHRCRELSGCTRDGNPSTTSSERRVPSSRISSRHPDGPGRRLILRSPNTKRDNLGRPDVDRGQGPENQRSLYRRKSSPKLDGNRSEPRHALWERSHTEEKFSLPGAVQESDRSTTHRNARKTDVPRTGPGLF